MKQTNSTHKIPYISIDKRIESQIKSDRAAHWQNPFAFKDENVVRRFDKVHDRASLVRPAFVRDTEKILNVPAYSRYSDKTQVFSFTENDDISHRSLHVQLVARISRTIGTALSLNTDLIEAIALGHDVGHTPFGHAGEFYLSKLYQQHTVKNGEIRYFNHNVHSVRVLDTLFERNLSLQVLDGILCHNGEFVSQCLNMGSISTFDQLDKTVEDCTRNEALIDNLRPSTLEGCVVRLSDMIAYIGKDRTDAIKLAALNDLDCFDSSVIGVENAQIINNITTDIINNSYRQNHISLSSEVFEDLKRAKKQNSEFIYSMEGDRIGKMNAVEEMFSNMYERLLDDLLMGIESSSIFRQHINYICRVSNSMTKEEYLKTDPNLIVVDYIASMTDSYFIALFQHLFPGESHFMYRRNYSFESN